MQYELKNTTTGETKWVGAEEAKRYGIDTRNAGQKMSETPFIGKLMKMGSQLGTGLGLMSTNDENISGANKIADESLNLSRQAMSETDPMKKESLLKRSRAMSMGARDVSTTPEIESGLGVGSDYKPDGRAKEAFKTSSAATGQALELLGLASSAEQGYKFLKNLTPTKIQQTVTKVNSKLNPFSRIAESGNKAAKGQGFDWKQFEKKIIEGLNDPGNASDRTALLKYHNKNFKGNFGNMFPVEGVRKGADAAQALASRRGLDARWGPSSFLGKLISALKDSSDPIKSRYNKLAYQAFNDQLKKIPGVSNADAKIWLLNQVRDLGVTGYVAKKGFDVFDSLTGGSSK